MLRHPRFPRRCHEKFLLDALKLRTAILRSNIWSMITSGASSRRPAMAFSLSLTVVSQASVWIFAV